MAGLKQERITTGCATNLHLINRGWNHGAWVPFIGSVAVQEVCSGVSGKCSRQQPLHTFKAFILRALHAQLQRLYADTVINFEASMQVVQRKACLKQRVPLDRAVGQKRASLSCSHELAHAKFLKQSQSEGNVD